MAFRRFMSIIIDFFFECFISPTCKKIGYEIGEQIEKRVLKDYWLILICIPVVKFQITIFAYD